MKLFLCICVQNLDIYSIFKRTVSRGRYCSKKVNPRHRLVCIQSMFYLYVKETKNYIVFHLPKDFKFKSFLKFKDKYTFLKVNFINYFFQSLGKQLAIKSRIGI